MIMPSKEKNDYTDRGSFSHRHEATEIVEGVIRLMDIMNRRYGPMAS